jgi:AcrR family transcriptional regulator
MNFEGMFIDYRVEDAVLHCIAELGIDRTDLATVATRLHRVRSTLYRQYGTRLQLLTYTHRRALVAIDGIFRTAPGDRHTQFEEWWQRLLEFLRLPCGAAFRVLRTRVAGESLEDEELAQLPALVEWVGGGSFQPAVVARARAAWALAVSAAACEAGSDLERELARLAWEILRSVELAGGEAPGAQPAPRELG